MRPYEACLLQMRVSLMEIRAGATVREALLTALDKSGLGWEYACALLAYRALLDCR